MMARFLGHEPPDFVVDDMIDAIDVGADGVVDAGEFSFVMATMEREDLFRKL
jgi:Ca2+-binding EF-hand superfamily protein